MDGDGVIEVDTEGIELARIYPEEKDVRIYGGGSIFEVGNSTLGDVGGESGRGGYDSVVSVIIKSNTSRDDEYS